MRSELREGCTVYDRASGRQRRVLRVLDSSRLVVEGIREPTPTEILDGGAVTIKPVPDAAIVIREREDEGWVMQVRCSTHPQAVDVDGLDRAKRLARDPASWCRGCEGQWRIYYAALMAGGPASDLDADAAADLAERRRSEDQDHDSIRREETR